VTGVDIAANLVSQARTRAQAEGLSIRLDVGDVEQLPYANGEFQTVVQVHGLSPFVLTYVNPAAAAR